MGLGWLVGCPALAPAESLDVADVPSVSPVLAFAPVVDSVGVGAVPVDVASAPAVGALHKD